MRLLRHGIFGRQTKSARSQKAIKLAALFLVVASVAVIMARVFAEPERDLVRLTDGDISGTLTQGGSSATDVERDSTLHLDLAFSLDNAYAGEFCNSVWSYDLSTLTSNAGIFKNIADTTNAQIFSGGSQVGVYSISNNKIFINIDQTWLQCDSQSGPRTGVNLNLSVSLDLDPIKVGTVDNATVNLPGSEVSGGNILVDFDDVSTDIEERVHDEGDDSWRNGNDQSVIITQETNGTHTANYSATFTTDAFINDMQEVITVPSDQNQTLKSGSFYYKKCDWWGNCANNSDAISVPSQYITISGDGKTATIDFDAYFRANPSEFEAGSSYNVVYQAAISDTDLSGHTYSSTAQLIGMDESNNQTVQNHVFDTSTVSYTAHDQIPTSKTGTLAQSSNNKYVDYVITVGDGTADISGLVVSDIYSNDQDVIGDITVCESGTSNCSVIAQAAKTEAGYTGNDIKLFDYTFPNDAGAKQYTISYRTKLVLDAELGPNHRVHNLFKKTIGAHEYNGGEFTENIDYAEPVDENYLTKTLASQDNQARTLVWEVIVNPLGGAMTDVDVEDQITNWAGIPSSEFTTVVTSVKKQSDNTALTENTDYTVSTNNDIVTVHLNSVSEKLVITFTTSFTDYAEVNDLKNAYVYNEARLIQNWSRIDTDAASAEINPGDPDDNNKDGNIISFSYSIQDGDQINPKNTKAIQWTVTVNPDFGAADPDEDVWFSDQLPAGVSLERYESSSNTTVTKLDTIVKSTRVSRDNVVTERCGDGTGIPVTVVNGMIQPIKISEITENGLNCFASSPKLDGVSYVITYTTQIDDSILEDVSQVTSLTNTAYIGSSADDSNPRSASTTIDYRYPDAVEKQDTSAEVLEYDVINYSIDVNPNAIALNQDNPIVVTDVISSEVDLVLNSIVLKDDSGAVISDRANHTISYNSDARTLSVTVPDSEHCVISYSVRIRNAAPDATVFNDYSNTATVHAQIDFDSTATKRHSVSNVSGDISGDTTGTIFLKKTERDNVNAPIENVCFDLYEIQNDQSTKIDTYCTNDEGLATIDNLVSGKTYSWREVSAPVTFNLDNTGDHFFTFYERDSQSNATTQANYQAAVSYVATSTQGGNRSASEITIVAAGYVWPVTDERLRDDSTLSISKVVSGSIADYEKQFSFTLTLTDNSAAFVDPISYQKGATTGTLTPDSNGKVTFTLSHGETIILTGLAEGMDYEIEEDDYTSDGYTTTTPSNASGTLLAGTNSVQFANRNDYTEISTGIKLRNGALVAACVTFGIAFSILIINIALKIKKEVRA